jgi:hypothetical protein
MRLPAHTFARAAGHLRWRRRSRSLALPEQVAPDMQR